MSISQSTYKVISWVCPHWGDGFLTDGTWYTNTTPRCCGSLLCNLLLQLGKHVCPFSICFLVQFAVSRDYVTSLDAWILSLLLQIHVLMQYHSKEVCTVNSILLHLEKEKRHLLKCQDWQEWLLVCNSHMSHWYNEPNNRINTHSCLHPLSSSYGIIGRLFLTDQWQTNVSKFWLWLFSQDGFGDKMNPTVCKHIADNIVIQGR